MDKARYLGFWVVGLISVIVLAGCQSNDPAEPSGREKGAREATAAIAAGNLKLKEYPPMPGPPGWNEYRQLLRERCGVEFEYPKPPPGVAESTFNEEVGGWNAVMRAEIKRQYGQEIFSRLRREARLRWAEIEPVIPPPPPTNNPPPGDASGDDESRPD